MRKIIYSICLVLMVLVFNLTLALCQESMAGVNGANRVVTINGGYGGVKGVITEPESFRVHDPPTLKWGAPVKNIPQMYMGVGYDWQHKTAIEIDAGATWEQLPMTDADGTIYAQGWAAFIRVFDRKPPYTHGYQYMNGSDGIHQWRTAKGSLGEIRMTFVVQPTGSIKLYLKPAQGNTQLFEGGPQDTTALVVWPKENGKIRSDVVANMRAKRVIALTQNDGLYYNGANMLGTDFSGGKVAKISISSSGVLSLGDWDDWSTAPQKSDNFIPNGRNGDATGQPNGVWVIDMRSPHARQANGVPQNRSTLYDAEKVDIRLEKSPGVLKGEPTTIGNK